MDWNEWANSMTTTFTRHHSPELIFLGGYVKDIVHRTKVGNMTDQRQRMSNDIVTIDDAMLQRTWQEIENRLGAHIKVY